MPCGSACPALNHRSASSKKARLTAVEITREQRSPVIAALQRTLFALGIVVSSYHVRYHARARTTRLVERIVLERSDGGSIDGALSIATKAAILPIALEHGEVSTES